MAKKKKTHYTRDEAEQRLRALTNDEIDRATLYSEQISGYAKGAYDPRELLDDAYVRTLDGTRQWKVGMQGPEHLYGVMHSVQSSWLKRDKRAKKGTKALKTSLKVEEQELAGEWPVEQLVDLQQSAQDVLKSGKLTQLEADVLKGFVAGLEPKVIMSSCGIDSKRYVEILLSLSARLAT
jgi:hypothetical protein